VKSLFAQVVQLDRLVAIVADQHIATAGVDLKVVHVIILAALYERNGRRAKDLAAAIGFPATSFTPSLDSAESDGLVERRADKLDRRAVNIYLTPKAEAMRDQVLAAYSAMEHGIRIQIDDFVSRLPEMTDHELAIALARVLA